MPHILTIVTAAPLEEAAQDILRTWDYVLAPVSAGAAIYTAFLSKLERIVFSAMLGDDETLINSYLGTGSTLLSLTNRYVSRSRSALTCVVNLSNRTRGCFNPGRLMREQNNGFRCDESYQEHWRE